MSDLPQRPPQGTNTKSPLAVLFRVGAGVYALPCTRILEVLPFVELYGVPQAPPWVAGSLLHRATLIAVVDLCQLIGDYPCPPRLSSRILVVSCPRSDGSVLTVGLLAEQVTEARRLNGKRLDGAALETASYLGNVLIEGGAPLRLLDVDQLMTGPRSPLLDYFSRAESGRLEAHEARRSSAQP